MRAKETHRGFTTVEVMSRLGVSEWRLRGLVRRGLVKPDKLECGIFLWPVAEFRKAERYFQERAPKTGVRYTAMGKGGTA